MRSHSLFFVIFVSEIKSRLPLKLSSFLQIKCIESSVKLSSFLETRCLELSVNLKVKVFSAICLQNSHNLKKGYTSSS